MDEIILLSAMNEQNRRQNEAMNRGSNNNMVNLDDPEQFKGLVMQYGSKT